MCGSVGVQTWLYGGNKERLFSCVTMRELGEDDYEKGGALSRIRPTYNLIDI